MHRFCNERRRRLRTVEPNAAHVALARLEAESPEEVLVITQNVDDLHERAGSRSLVHVQGELSKARCMVCGAVHAWTEDLSRDTACPACARRGTLRPDILPPGEAPQDLARFHEVLERCGLFLAIGVSGGVLPAERIIEEIGPFAYTVEVHAGPSRASSVFFEHRRGKAADLVPALVEELLAAVPAR